MVEQDTGTLKDIDKGMRLACGCQMGPFETGDTVGLNIPYSALVACYEKTKDSRFYPTATFEKKC